MSTAWERCLDRLEVDLTPEQFNTWIRPLHAMEDGVVLRLLAPNQFVRDKVSAHFLDLIEGIVRLEESAPASVTVQVGSRTSGSFSFADGESNGVVRRTASTATLRASSRPRTGLDAMYTFDNFVEGKPNQMARAASVMVASNPNETDTNPLYIYGGVGLGKTHLMHAIGNRILKDNPEANVLFVPSEQFVAEMVTAFQHHRINEFKSTYRTVDALLVDDVQFLAGKEGSQEEFFHTFNRLRDSKRLIVLTSDRYPTDIEKLEDRLKSRFGGGLPIRIEPPDFETRVGILMNKAMMAGTAIPNEVAYFIANLVHSHVRALEGALSRVFASAKFKGRPVTIELTREALRDLLAQHERSVSVDNIQRTVAQYFKIRVNDLISKKRSRSVARPRHIAMALAKELTNHSLPEIGNAFGGRDHTTVLYACRRVTDLRKSDMMTHEDYDALVRILTT